jgi:EpsD family peptidyl-prolyl cis-trans isomerase
MSNTLVPPCAIVVVGLIWSLSLAGCGKQTKDAPVAVGQVIAHVGTDDITAQELENEFRLDNVPPDKRSDALVKRVLGEIVARKYLVQQALAAKLDREPAVHLDIMRSREQVLSNAVVQRNVDSKFASIGKSDVNQFIGAHPSQFAKRELLNIEQINFAAGADTQAVVDATKTYKTLDQVDQKLTEMGISHTRSPGSLDSGNMSEEFLAALKNKNSDDIFFLRNGSNATFFKVTGEQLRPLTGDEAVARAHQLMRIDLAKAEGERANQAAEASAKFEGNYATVMGVHEPGKENGPAKN